MGRRRHCQQCFARCFVCAVPWLTPTRGSSCCMHASAHEHNCECLCWRPHTHLQPPEQAALLRPGRPLSDHRPPLAVRCSRRLPPASPARVAAGPARTCQGRGGGGHASPQSTSRLVRRTMKGRPPPPPAFPGNNSPPPRTAAAMLGSLTLTLGKGEIGSSSSRRGTGRLTTSAPPLLLLRLAFPCVWERPRRVCHQLGMELTRDHRTTRGAQALS